MCWIQVHTTSSRQSRPGERFGHTAVSYKNCMYVFGGWDGSDTLNDLYQFTLETSSWMSFSGGGNKPSPRYRHSAVMHGCCMFVFGGVDKRQTRFNDLYEFNIERKGWACVKVQGTHGPSPRTFHSAVVCNGMMWVLGGYDGARQSDIWRINLVETVPKKNYRFNQTRSQYDGGGTLSERGKSDLEVVRLRACVIDLKKRLEKEEERQICKICFEREIDTVIMPCAHRVACRKCATELDSCPLDRIAITNRIHTISG
eukprot:GHVR01099303.1.p1 GENE.GHVR01099303.1~~GHVR01099303.1.p1  ORF type:complete len:257 (+),score=50.03 GHVR01099303.1:251-1021(+)